MALTAIEQMQAEFPEDAKLFVDLDLEREWREIFRMSGERALAVMEWPELAA
jgi:hypothetical protein